MIDINDHRHHRYYLLLGLSVFLLLSIMAAVFYEERIAFADASFQLFSIILKSDFAIQVGRFGAVVTQIFPLIVVKLGLPLKQVMLSYSLAFVLFPFLLYLLLFFWIKSRKMALVLALFCILMTSHTFYWIQSELLQGCALVIFLFGWIDQVQCIRAWHLAIFYLLIVVILFVHPLTFIPFCFLWVYFLLQKKGVISWHYYSLMGFAILLLIVKHFCLPNSSYDAISMGLAKNAYKFWKFFQFKSTRNFWMYCLTDYYFFPVLLIWISYFYYQMRQKWKLGLLLSFTFAYLQLVNGTYSWESHQFHLESFYQVLSIFLLLPLIYEVLPHWNFKNKYSPYFILAAIICIRILHITIQHKPYTQRVVWLKKALKTTTVYPSTKFIINEKNVPIDTVINGWAVAFESLFLSAQHHPDSTRSIFIHNDDVPIEEFSGEKEAFLTPFGPINYRSIPIRYFNFKDTLRYMELERLE